MRLELGGDEGHEARIESRGARGWNWKKGGMRLGLAEDGTVRLKLRGQG